MESCCPGTKILVPMLNFVHDGRGTSTNVHPYLRDIPLHPHLAYHLASLLLNTNFVYFTGDLASFWTTSWSLPSAVQSLTTRLCPGTQQLTYFRRLSTNSLVALVSVYVSFQNQALLKSFTWTFLFSIARWLFDNLQLSKTVSFSYFEHLFLYLLAVILLKYLMKADDYYSCNKAHLLNFR